MSNILNQSSHLPNGTDIQSSNVSLSNDSPPRFVHLYPRKQSHRKSKQYQPITNNHSIPLALATSLHSDLSLHNEDDFLTEYIHQLFPDKHHL